MMKQKLWKSSNFRTSYVAFSDEVAFILNHRSFEVTSEVFIPNENSFIYHVEFKSASTDNIRDKILTFDIQVNIDVKYAPGMVISSFTFDSFMFKNEEFLTKRELLNRIKEECDIIRLEK